MKIICWNVNGIRAICKKDFYTQLPELEADIVCLQETKAQDDQVAEVINGRFDYLLYTNSAEKKGYSGTAILTRQKPISLVRGIGMGEHDNEGRVLTAEFGQFFLVNVYVPNSGQELLRLSYRKRWDADFLKYVKAIEKKKPVILCGDMNVAHRPIDIARPEANYDKTAGYTQLEIDGMDNIINSGLVDVYRFLNPETGGYTWWSYRAGARAKNIGWRIDYFILSRQLLKSVKSADILAEISGSDHCPVCLDIRLN